MRDAWPLWIGITLFVLVCVPACAGASGGQRTRETKTWVGGTVYSPDSVPVGAARVVLRSITGDFRQIVYTDATGRFSIGGVPPGNYSVEIVAAGYEQGSWTLVVNNFPLVGLSYVLSPVKSVGGSKTAPGNEPYTVSVRQLQIPEKALKEFRKGVQSEASGKIDDAIHHWEKSIRTYPSFAESYMKLSQAYANRGEFGRALDDAQRAVKIDGKDGDAYTYLGYVYLKEKDLGKAEEAFGSAVRLSDTEWFAQLWLGKLLLGRNQAQLAYPHLLRANRMKPEMPEPYLFLYNDLAILGRNKEALAEIDAFLARFPKHPLAAKAREKRKALAKAIEEQKP